MRLPLLLFLGLLWIHSASTAPQDPVLVLLEDLSLASTHSLFLQQLKDAGYVVDVRAARDKSLKLQNWDSWAYSRLIILASTIPDFGGAVDSETILKFIDSGHDVLIAVDSQVSEELRGLIGDLGVDVEPKGTAAIDHIDYVQRSHSVDHSVVASSEFGAIDGLFGNKPPEAGVVYQGIGMSIPHESRQVLNALAGSATTFLQVQGKPLADNPRLAGPEAALVALVQARNNARVVVAGSIAMFSNSFWQGPLHQNLGARHAVPGNREFCTALREWVFHERGQLRASRLRHHRVGEADRPSAYRVSDELTFSLDIQELVHGRATDVQLEFVMLDPYVRATLSPSANGTLSTTFKVPDVYGVFKFRVDYKRSGYTSIDLSEQVPVRPFRHNEYERFIVSAFPYYMSALSLMAAFVVLDVLFLYQK